ncbi:20459_t:CDS:2, partial [Funneliformis geosporum]
MDIEQIIEKLNHAIEELETFYNKKQERLDELLLKMANGEEGNDHQKKYWGIMIDELREEKARLNDLENFLMGQSETISSEDVDRRASDRIKK